MNWMRSNRKKLENDFLNSERRAYLSPAYYGQYQVTLPLVKQYAKGHLIDLGCGDMPYRRLIEDQVEIYDSLDFIPRSNEVKYVGSVQNMSMIAADTYDSAICLEVLEHVPDPFQAVNEINRILRAGGTLVLSVPHLSRLHDVPYDFYRYTCFGLEHLLTQAGFEILFIQDRGGLLSFLGHQVSLAALSVVWGLPLINQLAFLINSVFVSRLFYYLDRALKLGKLFPLGYAVVAIKKRSL